MDPSARQRIAIIGSGISGLVTAHLLDGSHDVAIIEADERLGGRSHTHDVEIHGERRAVDSGFMMMNPRSSPTLEKLLKTLEVKTRSTDMSFSVRCDKTGLEFNGASKGQLFAQKGNLFKGSFHGMLRDIKRFGREAKKMVQSGADAGTVGEFIEAGKYGEGFADHYLVPLGSAVWSCPPDSFRAFPIAFVAEHLDRIDLLSLKCGGDWQIVSGGSYELVKKLAAGFTGRIDTGRVVTSVARLADAVEVKTNRDAPRLFDHVILACHADQALHAVTQPTATETEILGAFRYAQNDVVLHIDPSVLPGAERTWGAMNLHVREDDHPAATVTYHANLLQGIQSKHCINVTYNEIEDIHPDSVLAEATYFNPIFDEQSAAVRSRHEEMVDHDRISYCGGYWGHGFLEDGVRSGLAVAAHFGKSLP